MPVLENSNFDNLLWIIGDPSNIPDGTFSVCNNVNAVRTNTIRPRLGIAALYPNIPVISVYNFYSNNYGIDNAGKLYENGAIIDSTLIPGRRASFVKAPPAFGAPAYLFAAGVGTGRQIKISPTGIVSNWGIAPPSNTMTGVVTDNISTVIDHIDSTTGWTPTNATLATDSTMFLFSTGSLKVTVNNLLNAIVDKTNAVDLAPGGSSDNDLITFYVAIDKPQFVNDVVLEFDLNTGYTTDYYSCGVAVAGLVGNNTISSTNDIALTDPAAQLVLNNPQNNPTPALPSGMTNEYYQAFQNYYYNSPYSFSTPTGFQPSPGSMQQMNSVKSTITPANNGWWKVRMPRSAFTRFGTSGDTWANVTGYRFRFLNSSAANQAVVIHLNELGFIGGTGMLGDYRYLVTFGNSTSQSQSNPNTTPLHIMGVERQSVTLSNIPVSADPQVNQRIIYRTVGNGGLLFQCIVISDNTTTTTVDNVSDFIGYGTNDTTSTSLSLIPLSYANQVPPSTIQQAAFWNGQMFLCGDTAVGCKGKVYYSAPGYAEGIAGYTNVTNDDDPTVGFGIWNNGLYLFTQKGVFQAVDLSVNSLSPLFQFIQVLQIPGSISAQSIIETPKSIIYQAADGIHDFTGYESPLILTQTLPLYRGEAVSPYTLMGPIVAADYGRSEYIFSDGIQCFAIDGEQRVRLISTDGTSVTAIFYDHASGEYLAGVLGGWNKLEQYGTSTDPGVAGIPLSVTPKGWYSGEKYVFKVQRVFIDGNLNGNSLTLTLIVDGIPLNLTTITGTTRTVFEWAVNQSGHLIQVNLAGNITTLMEIFKVCIEVDDDEETKRIATNSINTGRTLYGNNSQSGGTGQAPS